MSNHKLLSYSLIPASILLSGNAMSAEVAESGATVPEPSVAILGGICGLLLL